MSHLCNQTRTMKWSHCQIMEKKQNLLVVHVLQDTPLHYRGCCIVHTIYLTAHSLSIPNMPVAYPYRVQGRISEPICGEHAHTRWQTSPSDYMVLLQSHPSLHVSIKIGQKLKLTLLQLIWDIPISSAWPVFFFSFNMFWQSSIFASHGPVRDPLRAWS